MRLKPAAYVVLILMIAFMFTACGGGGGGGVATPAPEDPTGVWDQSSWDSKKYGP
ncbi:hypothetical protein ACFL4R_01965 [Nitrospirota bacterium]